jgi:Protein of unknown function (DUF3887)
VILAVPKPVRHESRAGADSIVVVKIIASLLLTALFAINPKVRPQSPIEQTARELLINFAAGRFEAASIDFNDALRPIVTPAVLAGVKEQCDRQVGAFQFVTEVHQGREDGFRVVELIAKFERSPVSVRVVFDNFDRVGGVHINPIAPPPVEPALEASARELLTNIVAGHFDEAGRHFDDTMRAQLPPAGLVELSRKIANTYGTFRSVSEVHQRFDKTYRIIDVIAVCDKMPIAFRVAFDAQDRIAAVHISPYKP